MHEPTQTITILSKNNDRKRQAGRKDIGGMMGNVR
jgi:hypothetical protein